MLMQTTCRWCFLVNHIIWASVKKINKFRAVGVCCHNVWWHEGSFFFCSTKKKVELEWRRSKSVLSKISCFEFKTISWCHTKIRYVCIFRVRRRKLEMKEAWSFWKKDDLSKSNNWERKEWTFLFKFNNFFKFHLFFNEINKNILCKKTYPTLEARHIKNYGYKMINCCG